MISEDIRQKEQTAKKLLSEGSYLQAKDLYQKLASSVNSFDAINYYEKKAAEMESYYRVMTEPAIGEIQFPVYNQAAKSAAILRLKVERTSNPAFMENGIQGSWTKIRELMKKFLKRYISDNLIYLHVFDWQLEEFSASILPLPHMTDHEQTMLPVEGSSLELPLFIAAFSALFELNMPSELMATGALAWESGKVRIKSVDHLDQKLEIIVIERPFNSRFYIPESLCPKVPFIRKAGSIEAVLQDVFGNLNEIIDSRKSSPGIKKIFLKLPLTEVRSEDGFVHSHAYFEHDNLPTDDLTWLNDYLKGLSGCLKADGKGLIIDGLKPIFSYAMLLPYLKNNISNFIAINYIQGRNGNGNPMAIVVMAPEGNNGTVKDKIKYRRVGEVFHFIKNS